ncbi:hypothetical protein RHGRI_023825 [Rhododendron griersonianum]|uniref:Uncharacterized protein n=1 Tax=Rhododendron griersonianum TaxID=479676 RepID=A0AAV6J8P8_9ERIC|nr:hypothetical protein RHGRI_023825 [Rhododendron griersonianum]
MYVTAAGGGEGGVPLLLELLPGAVRDREFAGLEEGGRDGGVLGGDGGTEELLRRESYFVKFSKRHGLVACGGEDDAVECFDMRVRSSVGRNVVSPAGDIDQVANLLLDLQVTAVEFDGEGGYLMSIGVVRERYGSPISNIKWHQTLNSVPAKLITTDNKIVRIWDPETLSNTPIFF